MKKRIIMVVMLATFTSIAYCSQPVRKQPKKATVTKTDSISAIIAKAEAGDAIAQNTLGLWYYTGKSGLLQDYDKALQWWASSANQNNADAIGNMAMCYQLGRGTEKDSIKATKLYEAAILKGNKNVIPQHEALAKNAGSIFSSLLLRECYIKGVGVARDPKMAIAYLTKAAENGHVDSQYTLALQLLNNKEADNAVKWFKEAAKNGNIGATYYLGSLLFNGMGITQDKENGIKLMQKAADADFTMAIYQLGKIYKEGDGIEKDAEKAFSFIKKAALQGNGGAKWMLGKMYLDGEGVAQDYYLATQWIAEVALKSHKNEINELLKADNEGTYSQYLMGLRKYYIDKDYESAITYFKKVEKAKNVEGTTMLGVCLASKDYAKRNLKKAIKTLTKAASASPVANYYLSSMYETGTGVDKDDHKAVELLKKAADAGIAYAECKLGDRYMTGNGVTRDFTKAAQLYLDAEAQNHLTPQSAKNLVECYNKKLSVLQDLKEADKRIEKLNKQAVNGNLVNLLKLLEK